MCIADILVHLTTSILAFLSIEHVPEEAEPLIEETTVGRQCWDIRSGEIFPASGLHILLGISVHGVITQAIAQQVPVLVATTAGAMLLDLDLGVGVENGARAVKHAIAEEILVDVRVQQGPVVIYLKLSWSGLRRNCAVIHHGHRGITNRTVHGVHVGHIGVVHGS